MNDLTIRRKGFATPQYQPVGRMEKPSEGARSQKLTGTAGFTISGTLQQLMNKASQVEIRSRESRRTLQTGEAALDEVQDSLARMEELARQSATGKSVDRTVLQAELEQLRENISRVIDSASAGDVPLFLDGDTGAAEGVESLLYETAGKSEGLLSIPDWLIKGIAQSGMSKEQILSALGLDKTASGSDILAAIVNSPLENSSAAGYLATLYLGAVISNGAPPDGAGLKDALEGLWQLLDQLESGIPLDRAIETLTKGAFTSMADFQAQFTGGTAAGLEAFLVDILLSGGGPVLGAESSLLSLMEEIKGMNLESLMGLLSVSQPDQPGAGVSAAADALPQASPGQQPPAQTMGNVLVQGQDLSGASLDVSTGVLTVSGTADVTIQGTGQGEQAILVDGTGQVTVRDANISVLTVGANGARMFCSGESILKEVNLPEGAVLTLDGGGLVKIGILHGNESNTLRLLGGAAVMLEQEGEETKSLTVPVVVEGLVSLAARAVSVRNAEGKPLEPFDVIWKALLPGWNSVTALEMEGQRTKTALMNGELIRLWLTKGDPSHGAPIHRLVFRGQDVSGRPAARYAYLHWSQETGSFYEIPMYPNPFSVTGGEPGLDWVYEEELQTLHILTSKVTAISGGSGTDAARAPFSGRIALADGIGAMELSLGGVTCRVSSGRAFSLGQGNEVTLILQSGTSNLFESGAGCAGISLGSGTSLNIDCADLRSGGDPDGVLTATGGAGGAGIGWDGEEDWEQPGQILIRGGVSVGMGNLMGSVTIIGGIIISADGKGGGETGLSLQIGGDTVALPQFRLSSRILRLDGLSVETWEQAQEASVILETDRRWVSRIQTAYGALYRQMEQSFGGLYSQYINMAQGALRDNGQAGALLEDMTESILLQPSQALRTHSRRGKEDVGHLLQ